LHVPDNKTAVIGDTTFVPRDFFAVEKIFRALVESAPSKVPGGSDLPASP
jgi:hypothetical protein